MWRHSAGVAAVARKIVLLHTKNEELGDEAFTAALLHDIGKVVLTSLRPDEYKAAKQYVVLPPADNSRIAVRGFDVTLRERSSQLGGMLARIPVGASREPLAAWTDWLAAECHRLGVHIETDTPVDGGTATIVATGSVAAPPGFAVTAVPTRTARSALLTAPAVLAGVPLQGPVLLHDPLGGPIAVALAELLAGQGYDTGLVTPDRIAGKHLAQTGDLVAANARLQRAGVLRHLASRIRSVDADGAVLEDVHTGKRRRVPCATVVDCGHRLPEPANVAGIRVGDCVAPRTVLEAVREARAAALAVAT